MEEKKRKKEIGTPQKEQKIFVNVFVYVYIFFSFLYSFTCSASSSFCILLFRYYLLQWLISMFAPYVVKIRFFFSLSDFWAFFGEDAEYSYTIVSYNVMAFLRVRKESEVVCARSKKMCMPIFFLPGRMTFFIFLIFCSGRKRRRESNTKMKRKISK